MELQPDPSTRARKRCALLTPFRRPDQPPTPTRPSDFPDADGQEIRLTWQLRRAAQEPRTTRSDPSLNHSSARSSSDCKNREPERLVRGFRYNPVRQALASRSAPSVKNLRCTSQARLRRDKPRAAKPRPRSTTVAGSGARATDTSSRNHCDGSCRATKLNGVKLVVAVRLRITSCV